MDKRNSFNKFLLPQNTISDTFIASILILISIYYLITRNSYTEMLPFILIIALISSYSLVATLLIKFFHIGVKNRRILKSIQITGSIQIFIISIFYTFTLLAIFDFNKISPINYIFLFYSFLMVLRFIFLYFILTNKNSDDITRIFKIMPESKILIKNNILLILITMLSIYLYFKNTDILSIALGQSFFASVICFDIIKFIKNKRETTKQGVLKKWNLSC